MKNHHLSLGHREKNPSTTCPLSTDATFLFLIPRFLQMFAYGTAALLLYMIAPRVDGILSGSEEPEPEPVKHIVGGDFMADKVGGSTSITRKGRVSIDRSADRSTDEYEPTPTMQAQKSSNEDSISCVLVLSTL